MFQFIKLVFWKRVKYMVYAKCKNKFSSKYNEVKVLCNRQGQVNYLGPIGRPICAFDCYHNQRPPCRTYFLLPVELWDNWVVRLTCYCLNYVFFCVAAGWIQAKLQETGIVGCCLWSFSLPLSSLSTLYRAFDLILLVWHWEKHSPCKNLYCSGNWPVLPSETPETTGWMKRVCIENAVKQERGEKKSRYLALNVSVENGMRYVQSYYYWLIGKCICAFDWHQGRWPWTALSSNFRKISRNFTDLGSNNG